MVTAPGETALLAMQSVDPIGSAPTFADDVARARALAPLAREKGCGSLAEYAQRFIIGHPAVSTMLIGTATLEQLEVAIAAVAKGPL
jgi:aryl-alcohol dehydrogenase-like predicted oxidoreductase